MERPHSRYTRPKTWAALYTQHINAGYALVPHSSTNNSVDVVYCETPAKVKAAMLDMAEKEQEIKEYYSSEAYKESGKPYGQAITAIVLAKSSDYYHYRLFDYVGANLVICGRNDSYLQLRIWETHSNKRYEPRETVIPLKNIKLGKNRMLDHNILLGALVCGDKVAIAYRDDKTKMSRWTRKRLIQKVQAIQSTTYQGRPLAFLNEAKRKEIGDKISYSLMQYHTRRRA